MCLKTRTERMISLCFVFFFLFVVVVFWYLVVDSETIFLKSFQYPNKQIYHFIVCILHVKGQTRNTPNVIQIAALIS